MVTFRNLLIIALRWWCGWSRFCGGTYLIVSWHMVLKPWPCQAVTSAAVLLHSSDLACPRSASAHFAKFYIGTWNLINSIA
jgi:hypothetical protein